MKINGIAHIVLTVNRPALALPFYERLFGFLEFKTVFRHERGAYFIGGKTAVAIVPAEAPHDQAAFVQTRIGLHHLCFRAYAREDVDRLHAHLCEMGSASSGRRAMGAGLLLGAIRGPRRHPVGGEPRPGKGPPHRRGSLQPRRL